VYIIRLEKHAMKPITMMRRGRIEDLDRSFDLLFWQSQTPQTRFAATRELIVHAWRVKGHDVRQLQLQRSVETVQRQQRCIEGRPLHIYILIATTFFGLASDFHVQLCYTLLGLLGK